MTLRFYGTMLCGDCVAAKEVLDNAGTPYTFTDITGDIAAFKEFTRLRDTNPAFDPIKAEGLIGIPAFISDENPGDVIFDVDKVV